VVEFIDEESNALVVKKPGSAGSYSSSVSSTECGRGGGKGGLVWSIQKSVFAVSGVRPAFSCIFMRSSLMLHRSNPSVQSRLYLASLKNPKQVKLFTELPL
jgi:hypothetical protein